MPQLHFPAAIIVHNVHLTGYNKRRAGASSLQGTPYDFLLFVVSIHHSHSLQPLILQTTKYMEAWGIQTPEVKLNQTWSKLSGGESQRVLLAIALATRPKLLLLDEATSALDLETKLKVEQSISASDCAIILITHDEDQMKRVGTINMSLDVASA